MARRLLTAGLDPVFGRLLALPDKPGAFPPGVGYRPPPFGPRSLHPRFLSPGSIQRGQGSEKAARVVIGRRSPAGRIEQATFCLGALRIARLCRSSCTARTLANSRRLTISTHMQGALDGRPVVVEEEAPWRHWNEPVDLGSAARGSLLWK